MNIAYLCPKGHLSIIRKSELLTGRIPAEVVCPHLYCGCASFVFEAAQMDDSLTPTHEFYKLGSGEIGTIEEHQYCNAGGLLFRTIEANQPKEVINEFMNTGEVVRLAEYLVKEYPAVVGKGTPVDAAINLLTEFKQCSQN